MARRSGIDARNDQENVTINSITPIVPTGIERPKRIAKALSGIYSTRKLSDCQAVTAQLFGFEDWHSLEEIIKKKAKPGPFDDDLSDVAIAERRNIQRHIIAQDLGNVDLHVEYLRPEKDPLDLHGEKRLERAYQRFQQRLAHDAIFELTPTSLSHPIAHEPFDGLCLCTTEEFFKFPQKLARWWKVNIPHQAEIGTALGNHDFNVKSPVSILNFAHYWGTLCMYYANTIDWMMAMGTSQILAEGYSATKIFSAESISTMFGNTVTSAEKDDLADEALKIKIEIEADFYKCFPRDDFLGVWRGQMKAFYENAQKVSKILAKPGSRKGVWK